MVTRRRWLGGALALAGLPAASWARSADGEVIPFLDEDGFVLDASAANPRVKHYDLKRLSGLFTPVGEFFVFHQTSTPQIDLAKWRLRIGGLVERPQAFSFTDLVDGGLPGQEIEMTLECSGNMPRRESLNGQVGNARWSGIPLAAVLRRCGLKAEAREVVFFGADESRDSSGLSRGPHGRSVFVQDALDPDAILATRMNGEPLTAEHGFPLRLILPGWYGMAQIKWLTRIEVLDRRYEGLHMSRNYQTLHAVAGEGEKPLHLPTSISRTRMKSVIAKVTRRPGQDRPEYRIAGAAWGGLASIERVEVKIDAGAWLPARIDQRGGRHGWLLWSCAWPDAASGRHVLTSRAIDAHGKVQPTKAEWGREILTAREDNAQWERAIHLP